MTIFYNKYNFNKSCLLAHVQLSNLFFYKRRWKSVHFFVLYFLDSEKFMANIKIFHSVVVLYVYMHESAWVMMKFKAKNTPDWKLWCFIMNMINYFMSDCNNNNNNNNNGNFMQISDKRSFAHVRRVELSQNFIK